MDERSVNSSSLLLYWWIPVPAGVKFQFLPSYAEVGPGAVWTNQTEWVSTLQTRIDGLKSFTMYNLTVYVRIKGGSTVFPPAHFVTATTAEGGESSPGLVGKLLLLTCVTLQRQVLPGMSTWSR